MKLYICVAVIVGTIIANEALADSVYKWTSPDGIVHYSSKAPTKGAQPADLPPIMREKVKLVKNSQGVPQSCDQHGGINCQAGADGDGSVVCYDGFKNSNARFKFSCSSPKLEITQVSDVTDQGAFTVFIRNSKAVVAEKMTVLFRPDSGKEFRLLGPENIEPYGSGEFVFKPGQKKMELAKVRLDQLDITCLNCE